MLILSTGPPNPFFKSVPAHHDRFSPDVKVFAFFRCVLRPRHISPARVTCPCKPYPGFHHYIRDPGTSRVRTNHRRPENEEEILAMERTERTIGQSDTGEPVQVRVPVQLRLRPGNEFCRTRKIEIGHDPLHLEIDFFVGIGQLRIKTSPQQECLDESA